MAKDLDAKIASLVTDLDKLNAFDRARAIKRFVLNELEFQESTHEIDFNSLRQIHGRATTISRDLPSNFEIDGKSLYSFPELFRSFCHVQAAYEYFRTQKLTPFKITFRNRK